MKNLLFEKDNANWIDEIIAVKKQFNNKNHPSIISTPIQASLKRNVEFVYQKFLDKRKKIKPKFEVGDSGTIADKTNIFSEGDTTNWSYKLYTITEFIHYTIPTYLMNNLPERYKGALLKKTGLTIEENTKVMKKLELR